MPNRKVKKFLNSMFLSLRSSLNNVGYRVSLNRNNNRYFTVTKGKLTTIYRIHAITQEGELVLMDVSNNRIVSSANAVDLAKRIRLQMTLNRQRKFLQQRYGSVYGRKGLFSNVPVLNRFFNRPKGVLSNVAYNNEKYRENAKLRKMKNSEPFKSFNEIAETQPVKKSNALEETDFSKKKEVKSLLANDRMLYGTKIDIKDQMKKDLQQVDLKHKEYEQRLLKQKEDILKNEDNVYSKEQITSITNSIDHYINQYNANKNKMLNKDITVDVAEKLGYLLPGCNIKYESSFAVGNAGKRICNFNITFGGITKRCAIVESKHYLTKQPLYQVSTEIGRGYFDAGSIDELAKKIANGMLTDIQRETGTNIGLLNDSKLYDIIEAQNRIQQISDRRFDVDNRAGRTSIKDLHNDRNINI